MKFRMVVYLALLLSSHLGLAEDQQVVAHLEEIVKIRTQMIAREEALARDNRKNNLYGVNVDLLDARINLARERGQKKELTNLFEQLLEIHSNALEAVNLRMALGRAEERELQDLQIKILNTRIAMLSLKNP